MENATVAVHATTAAAHNAKDTLLRELSNLPTTTAFTSQWAEVLGTSRYAVAVAIASGGVASFLLLRALLRDRIADLPPPVQKTDPKVPLFTVDNPSIVGNYRQRLNLRQCLVSAFTLHNESFNIYSHALAASFFFAAALRRVWRWSVTGSGMESTSSDQSLYLMPVLVAGTLTYGTSTVAHTFCAHSAMAHDWLFAFDRASIAYIVGANVLACGMMRFPENSTRRRVYAGAAWIATLTCSAIVGLAPHSFPKLIIGAAFTVLTSLAEYPLISQILLSRAKGHHQFARFLLKTTLRAQIPLIAGMLMWALQFPESYFTTERWRFLDLVGHGHTIMHLSSWYATWLGYRLLKAWNRYLQKVAQGTAQ